MPSELIVTFYHIQQKTIICICSTHDGHTMPDACDALVYDRLNVKIDGTKEVVFDIKDHEIVVGFEKDHGRFDMQGMRKKSVENRHHLFTVYIVDMNVDGCVCRSLMSKNGKASNLFNLHTQIRKVVLVVCCREKHTLYVISVSQWAVVPISCQRQVRSPSYIWNQPHLKLRLKLI